MVLITPADVLYMEDDGPKRCDRCVHMVGDNACELFRPNDRISGPDGVCGLYVNGRRKERAIDGFAGLDPKTAGYGEDVGVGGYSCGNCKYGGTAQCRHPALDAPRIDNVGGCCNIWDYPSRWPMKPPVRAALSA